MNEDEGLTPPRVVLDTNVVLGWLLFQDPRIGALRAALEECRLHWVASPRMRAEFSRTLSSPVLERWQPDRVRLLDGFDARVQLVPEPVPAPTHVRCDDPTDQIFVDLALSCRARWLFSHDKALLRLRRRMPPQGPRICRPFDWPGA
jgi:putative PIN family toxin of toxin-antitoxin system